MAAGSAGASGRNSGSSPALESTLDRRFQTVNNTMESIQGLSLWCIENKKYHSAIVRFWLKWMRKSDESHRLNLFYLANDVIQNCKRKNAIVYRTTFTDVLPESIKLISALKDTKVTKSVERILTIWEDRSVYSGEFIRQLKNGLVWAEEPAKGQNCIKELHSSSNRRNVGEFKVSDPVNSKAALKSKIVAEFVPSAFIENLSKYRKSMDEIDLKEKQLAAMRVDVCSTEALKKLKDKAGGKRFSKDFEDGSTKLQDFVSFLDGEVKKSSPLMEALENADIFYEMQYKEVKIVAKAYETFANRVSHLKRKLDALKAMQPDSNDSPVPSPIEDAPSPTGSDSPYHTLGTIGDPDPDLDGQEIEDDMIALIDAPSPLSSVGGSPKQNNSVGETDNRDVEDMDLSDVEEAETQAIIVEERAAPSVVSKQPLAPKNVTESSPPTKEAAQTKQVTTSPPPVSSATPSLPVNFTGVDLGKISSILSTLTNVMKNSAVGVSPVSRSSPSVASTPSSTLKTPVAAAPPANPLANLLSRVDINPNALLSVLSKTQPHGGLQGLTSLLSNQTAKTPTPSTSDSDKSPLTPLLSLAHESPKVTQSPAMQLATDPASQACLTPKSSQSDTVSEKVNPSSSLNSTLESKIDNFLQGNPALKGFNLGFPSVLALPKGTVDSPLASSDNLVGTPVRDEAGSTPTQDEIMDDPRPEQLMYQQGPSLSADAKSTLPLMSWQDPNSQSNSRLQRGAEIHQNVRQAKKDSVLSLAEAEAKRHQLINNMLSTSNPSNQQSSSNNGEATTRPGQKHQELRQNSVNMGPNSELPMRNLYVDSYRDSQEQQALASSGGYGAEPYRFKDLRQDFNAPSFFTTPLPPIPNLPPPPQDFIAPVSSSRAGGPHVPLEEPYSQPEAGGIDGSYNQENSEYGEHFAQMEPFHPHGDGPSRYAPAPHHVPKMPQNAPVDYNHQHPQRAPQQHPPHRRLGSPPPVRGYHEGLSPPQPVPDNPYFDSYYEHPPRSPSPQHYEAYPVSPRAHEYYPEDLPPHYPEQRVPLPHLEHRPGPPHPAHLPHPGHYPPPRPLRRPPPVPYAHEPSFSRGKRPGPPFGGPPRAGGPFYPPKRPYLPPRY
ncbi:Regulation of nuclear pre-mRNA domain-containing protein 2 [Triplophysa tibetana]|uniref:Regulation of nuclear pre-mRNA domain-containing protein 2 n=1 Tax=Triplophysa tibetana TaxID=1572043 RepID=A0A5A9NLI6_9TELE|nr:Regulation of nuclear pre-mRNA domain-containing protein 2 [Triplophysa tibetana]